MQYKELARVIEVVKALRHPETGCPWDLEQNYTSLLPYLVEETYEYIYAVESQDTREMNEELGDVLLQILLHTTIAEQENSFTLESVCKTLADKLIRRHPHVFEEKNKDKISSQQVLVNWDKIKKEEKKESLFNDSYLKFPALYSAEKIGKKSKKVNFDWDDFQQVMYKVEEEWQELKEELKPHAPMNQDNIMEEIGDVLFSVTQLARHLNISAEEALRSSNKKFINRFAKMEQILEAEGKSFEQLTLEEKEACWQKAKIEIYAKSKT
ncbi:MAG: nucleoside triphosphate pyrophosphohydrolase [Bacteriovoracaceae bacterium]|nr:nucleoside triphosphate pyrophosphohydrolase [Bacteriovoracaceae bacterium]